MDGWKLIQDIQMDIPEVHSTEGLVPKHQQHPPGSLIGPEFPHLDSDWSKSGSEPRNSDWPASSNLMEYCLPIHIARIRTKCLRSDHSHLTHNCISNQINNNSRKKVIM